MNFSRKSFFPLAVPVAAAAVVLMSVCPAKASPTTLQDLLNGKPFVDGELTFSNFAGLPEGDASVSPSNIYVQSYQNPITHAYGIEFNSSQWEMSGASQAFDEPISFQVTANAGYQINGFSLQFNGSYEGTGSSVLSENIFDGDLTNIANKEVFYNIGGINQTYQHTAFTPESTVYVYKDFAMNTVNDGDQINISDINQSFDVTPVPEAGQVAASSMALLGLGSVFIRRRMIARAAK